MSHKWNTRLEMLCVHIFEIIVGRMDIIVPVVVVV